MDLCINIFVGSVYTTETTLIPQQKFLRKLANPAAGPVSWRGEMPGATGSGSGFRTSGRARVLSVLGFGVGQYNAPNAWK